MAEKTLFDYSELSAVAALNDVIGIVDVSDTTQSGSGSTKRITRSNFLGIGSSVQAWSAALDVWATKSPPSGTIVGTTDTQTLSDKTLTAPKIANGGFIADANGNELIKFVTAAGAVNDVTYTNAATGNAPVFEATGGDANIHLVVKAKGNGLVKMSVLRQDITTNTYKHNSVILTGWTHLPVLSGASTAAKSIAFGITFAAAPNVIPQIGGFTTAGAPATLADLTGTILSVGYTQGFGWDTITTTGFNVSLKTSGNAGANSWYGVTWIAIGEL